MKVSLVIMAAGLGSRYGGSKQVDGIGPHNEILMEYSIYDALRAGFNKVVFIIKPEMEEMMHRICGDYLAKKTALDGSPVEVAYAFRTFPPCRTFTRSRRSGPSPSARSMHCCARRTWSMSPAASSTRTTTTDRRYRTIYQELVKLPETGKGHYGGLPAQKHRQPPRHRLPGHLHHQDGTWKASGRR